LVFADFHEDAAHVPPPRIAAQLAERGLRVYSIASTFVSPGADEPRRHAVGDNSWVVSLPCSGDPPAVRSQGLTEKQIDSVVGGIDRLREDEGLTASLCIVEDPFWRPVAERLSNNRTVLCSGDERALDDSPTPMRLAPGAAAEQVLEAAAALFPSVTVILLTHNGLTFTRACLHSLDRHSDYPNWDLVIVDNASTDGTPEFLQAYAADRGYVRLMLLPDNRGFAAGNNAGARAARGEYLVFLNNDTYVTSGWMGNMVQHFERRPHLGLLNPVTNNIGNEARIDVAYADMEGMAREASRIGRVHRGDLFELDVCAFFCAMAPRRVWDDVGELDERFGMGFFEDDDYSRRTREKGYALGCAEDVFVHHHLSASFDVLGEQAKRELFERNQRLFEAKWGPWAPHASRGRRTRA
jgi:GT2 family glycosyltransferase